MANEVSPSHSFGYCDIYSSPDDSSLFHVILKCLLPRSSRSSSSCRLCPTHLTGHIPVDHMSCKLQSSFSSVVLEWSLTRTFQYFCISSMIYPLQFNDSPEIPLVKHIQLVLYPDCGIPCWYHPLVMLFIFIICSLGFDLMGKFSSGLNRYYTLLLLVSATFMKDLFLDFCYSYFILSVPLSLSLTCVLSWELSSLVTTLLCHWLTTLISSS